MKNCRKLKDEQMRSILFEYYEAKGKRLRFFEEFRLGRKTRADALLVTETEMIGFEFKSDKARDICYREDSQRNAHNNDEGVWNEDFAKDAGETGKKSNEAQNKRGFIVAIDCLGSEDVL